MQNKNLYNKTLINLFLIVTIFYSNSIVAQDIYINGVAVDTNNIILENPIVVEALSVDDSTFIFGYFIENGNISFHIGREIPFFLKISSLGYNDTIIEDIDISLDSVDLKSVKMGYSSLLLPSIEVLGDRKNAIEYKQGVYTINFYGSLASAGGSTVDLLKKIPGIRVKSDGAINLIGKGKTVIILDDNEYNGSLSDLNADQISKIEIIRNPSSEYQAAGHGGILKLTTKDKSINGLASSLSTTMTKADYFRFLLFGDISYKKDKFSLYASINWNPHKISKQEFGTRSFSQKGMLSSLINDVETTSKAWLKISQFLKLKYQINDYHKIQLNVKNFGINFTENRLNNITRNSIYTESSISKIDNKRYYLISQLNYKFSKNTYDLLVNLSHTYFRHNKLDKIKNVVTNLFGMGHNEISEFHYKSSLGKKMFKNKFKFKIGLEAKSVSRIDINQLSLESNKQEVIDTTNSNYLNYSENQFAFFVNTGFTIHRFDINAGIRREYNNIYGRDILHPSFKSEYEFGKFYPSVNIGFNIDESMTLNLAYSDRINHPNYEQIGTSVTYYDSNTIVKGNPNLFPEKQQGLEFTFAYQNNPLLSLGFNETNDLISPLIVNNFNQIIATNTNLELQKTIYGTITIPIPVKEFLLVQTINLTKTTTIDNELGIDKSGLFWYYNAFFEYDSKYFYFDMNYSWSSINRYGLIESEPFSSFDISISKNFIKKKLTISLIASDIFQKNYDITNYERNGFKLHAKSYSDWRYIRLSCKYKFKKVKKENEINIDRRFGI